MADKSQREFFDKLNAFPRNYTGKTALVQFVGLQLRYTGSTDTLVCRRLFTKLYVNFCFAQDSFPADLCQIGMHLTFAGIKSVTLRFKNSTRNFYGCFLVFGMPWDRPFCSPKHRYVFVSYLPHIEIVVKQQEDRTSQCCLMKQHEESLARNICHKRYVSTPSGSIIRPPPLKRRKAGGGEEGGAQTST
ncbi:uncharacterized protein LOC125027519 [Penaeus chinensis]|uniref:uncharacterized protein LOC125027519 n=1 Tax=Penaeus chinensis TaxID=139456 RepID=UPI001FB7D049|nr:uncharacterized protein LOC125027519 [Penaeus chinensis]